MNWSTSFSLCCARRLARFWKNGNLIQSRLICVNSLHWLPVKQRIQYKLRLLVYKCLHGLAPPYLSSMLTPVSSNRYSCHLRSAASSDLTHSSDMFCAHGSPHFCCIRSWTLEFFGTGTQKSQHFFGYLFKSLLETELFKRAYPVV